MNMNTYKPSTEAQRTTEQQFKNFERLMKYNNKRTANGLHRLSYSRLNRPLCTRPALHLVTR